MPTTTTIRRMSEFAEPVYRAEDVDAELMAEELSAHYEQIKRLNMAPATNEREIRRIRQQISEILLALVVHHECAEKGLA